MDTSTQATERLLSEFQRWTKTDLTRALSAAEETFMARKLGREPSGHRAAFIAAGDGPVSSDRTPFIQAVDQYSMLSPIALKQHIVGLHEVLRSRRLGVAPDPHFVALTASGMVPTKDVTARFAQTEPPTPPTPDEQRLAILERIHPLKAAAERIRMRVHGSVTVKEYKRQRANQREKEIAEIAEEQQKRKKKAELERSEIRNRIKLVDPPAPREPILTIDENGQPRWIEQ